MPRSRRPRLTARTADKHDLYQTSVQCPEADVRFFDRVYKKKNGQKAELLREDFCGTAYLCATWVRTRRKNRAIGVDLHAPTLDWGRRQNLEPLGEDADRVTLLNANVLDITKPKVDVLCALNFSYFVFQDRSSMRRYFQLARRSLKGDGILVLDLFGGPSAQEEEEEERDYPGFEYVWRQQTFDPVNNHCIYHIDFNFPDGSRIRPAFTYDWRLWSIPELRELLDEAGFAASDVYWEGTDRETDEGNGVYRQVTRAPADESWISYIVAHP